MIFFRLAAVKFYRSKYDIYVYQCIYPFDIEGDAKLVRHYFSYTIILSFFSSFFSIYYPSKTCTDNKNDKKTYLNQQKIKK